MPSSWIPRGAHCNTSLWAEREACKSSWLGSADNLSAILSSSSKWLAELHLKRRKKKKKKNSSQPKPKFDSLQLPETGNLHRQRNFPTVLPHCPRYKCRNLRKDFCISKLNTPWGLFHPGKCTYAAEMLFSTPSNKGEKKKRKKQTFIRFIYRMTLLLVAHWRPC